MTASLRQTFYGPKPLGCIVQCYLPHRRSHSIAYSQGGTFSSLFYAAFSLCFTVGFVWSSSLSLKGSQARPHDGSSARSAPIQQTSCELGHSYAFMWCVDGGHPKQSPCKGDGILWGGRPCSNMGPIPALQQGEGTSPYTSYRLCR